MAGALDVVAREALSREESPFGTVGVLHSVGDIDAWWIWKDREEIEPTPAVMDRDDLLYVVQGSLSAATAGRATAIGACSWRSRGRRRLHAPVAAPA